MSSLDNFDSRCQRNSLYERNYKMPSHENTFDDFFSEMLIEKTPEDMSMFVGKQKD